MYIDPSTEKGNDVDTVHEPERVDYYGQNWVTWLTARMLQYTGVHHTLEIVPYPEDDPEEEKLDVPKPTKRLNKGRSFYRKKRVLRGSPLVWNGPPSKLTRQELEAVIERYHCSNGPDLLLQVWACLGIDPKSWIISDNPVRNNVTLRRLIDAKEAELRRYRHVQKFPVLRNTQKLSKLLGLSPAAATLMKALTAAETGANLLQFLIGDVEPWDDGADVTGMMQEVFDFSERQIEELREPESKSQLVGLPRIDWKAKNGFAIHTTVLRGTYSDGWATKSLTTKQLTSTFFRCEAVPRLRVDNFNYLEQQVQLIVDYLRRGAEQQQTGVNVFLYGPPGTGKTQLARVVARAAKLRLYHTRSGGNDTNDFSQYNTTQLLLANTKTSCCLLMDESEDFFNRAEFSTPKESDREKLSKYRLNLTFELNPIPAVWVANSLQRIDPAHLRRFGLVVELPIPPRRVRATIFRKYTRGLRLSQHWIDEVAQNAAITPADIESTAQVVKLAGDRRGKKAEAEMLVVLQDKLKLRGHRMTEKVKLETRYDIQLSNSSAPLEPIVQGLQRSGEGRILLYGPPGTGKTAFARYVAEQVGKPLHAQKASDLLSMWVGENEKNIANMFRRAHLDDAVLLLDEADSFLQDRSGAHRSWEVTMVNEMLVQMEHFHGVFLCSSNLMDRLDQATFRRFDIKLKFDWMRSRQKLQMLRQLTTVQPSEWEQRRLAALSKLTPGDFAAVARRLRVLQEATPTVRRVLAELEEEAQFKKGGGRSAGFRA